MNDDDIPEIELTDEEKRETALITLLELGFQVTPGYGMLMATVPNSPMIVNVTDVKVTQINKSYPHWGYFVSINNGDSNVGLFPVWTN